MFTARYLVLIVILICSCAKTVDDNELSLNQNLITENVYRVLFATLNPFFPNKTTLCKILFF